MDVSTSPMIITALSELLRTGIKHCLVGALQAAAHCCPVWLNAVVSGSWARQEGQRTRRRIKSVNASNHTVFSAPFIKGESFDENLRSVDSASL